MKSIFLVLDMVVLEDCCAAHSAEVHSNSIRSISRLCRLSASADVGFGAWQR